MHSTTFLAKTQSADAGTGPLDAMFVLPNDFGDAGMIQLAAIIFTLLFAGWAWALFAAWRGSRGGLVTAFVINGLVLLAVPIGWLLVAPRAPGEAFTSAEEQLLQNIARQAGTAVHALQLTADLQSARQQIVTSREEERRRLRRDLHDGLGPSLAAQLLKVGSARALLAERPEIADQLLAEMESELVRISCSWCPKGNGNEFLERMFSRALLLGILPQTPTDHLAPTSFIFMAIPRLNHPKPSSGCLARHGLESAPSIPERIQSVGSRC